MPSRDPAELAPSLLEFWRKLKVWYETKFPDRQLILTCTHRTPAEQAEIFAANKPGNILTKCDGYKIKSKHNYLPAHAFDVAVLEGGKAQWQEVYYIPLGRAIGELGYTNKIRWGGWFSSWKDYPHMELIWPAKP